MPSHNAGHPGQPADRGPDPTASRDDSHKITPATDLQSDDATAADTRPAVSRDEAARQARDPRESRDQQDSSQTRAARAMKQQARTEQGR